MSRINIPGLIGNNELIDNAGVIDIGTSINGSGDEAFGGVEEWPTVRAEISFQTGQERRALDFARKLSTLIRSEFGPLEPEKRGSDETTIETRITTT